jgi:hypothetical protein
MGTVDDWLFADAAGILATSPGFRTVAINPDPVGDLTSASGYETAGFLLAAAARIGCVRIPVDHDIGIARADTARPVVWVGSPRTCASIPG